MRSILFVLVFFIMPIMAKSDSTKITGKRYQFEDAEVLGYLDNPTPVYIIDSDNINGDPIKLDRSFAEEIKENVDRETLERLKKK